MKTINSRILLLTFVFISFIACGQKENSKSNDTNTDHASISLISPADLNSVNKDILLIDVRTPEEFASGHLENAVNMNYFDSDFDAQLKTLDKNKVVYLYCKSGRRSANAAEKLENMGFVKIYDLEGGTLNWQAKGFKLSK
jgi:phage shock protein E